MRNKAPSCLVPRPHCYALVIRFGSRGPGRKVWPRQKSEKWDNLTFSLSWFPLAGGNSLSISGRGTAREKPYKLLAFGLMLIDQVKRPIWSKWAFIESEASPLSNYLSTGKYRLLEILSFTCNRSVWSKKTKIYRNSSSFVLTVS